MMMSSDNISDILYNGILGPCYNSVWLFLSKLKEEKNTKNILYIVLRCKVRFEVKWCLRKRKGDSGFLIRPKYESHAPTQLSQGGRKMKDKG